MRSRWSLVVLVAAACGHNNAATDAPPGGGDGDGFVDADTCGGVVPRLAVREIIGSGLVQPVYVTQPAGSTDLFVVEKPGRLRIVRGGALLATPFLDLTAQVNIPNAGAEGGTLGVEFAPDYMQSGRLWVITTLKATASLPDRVAIVEVHRSVANPDVADPATEVEIISSPHGGFNNVGGTVRIGPDGKLWTAFGDNAFDANGQDLTLRLGKVLRVDPDAPSVPPSDNLGGANVDPYIWDSGLHNPYRFAFDRVTHAMYLADPDDELYQEVDVEAPGQGHRNYGWPIMEGDHCHTPATGCDQTGLTLPVYERPHGPVGYSEIIGGVVYRGAALPCLRGRYLFGIIGLGYVLSWVWDGTQVKGFADLTNMLNADLTNIDGFGEDDAGEVYITTLDGHVYEIVPG